MLDQQREQQQREDRREVLRCGHAGHDPVGEQRPHDPEPQQDGLAPYPVADRAQHRLHEREGEQGDEAQLR